MLVELNIDGGVLHFLADHAVHYTRLVDCGSYCCSHYSLHYSSHHGLLVLRYRVIYATAPRAVLLCAVEAAGPSVFASAPVDFATIASQPYIRMIDSHCS